ncbi:hypothetical protein SAMN05216419_101220 [Nitrosomonas cryotolerans]|uniref:Sulfotransferase family protein n=1 Tax=Nitrosomonas cryotolerans ATCC 49181 TaxID=1131553 RepID=A0A1N6JFH8_9PROT|nr:hypothetical protein [Nitrosomonas cryotolerans]SFP66938.1 hypothetical protein SAMN05216419_101220 [Nitrosomonas cryotolerans]SIO43045.1 hypothetical protein SAMN02743940_2571 [Nitrosomonas cryotolerans ATCC 49181]
MKIIVVGRAKTGTTVISKTIASGAGISDYHLEPRRIDFFIPAKDAGDKSAVVKLIADHWEKKPRLRNAILHNELPMTFDKKIVIIRDFRDELLSRLLYVSFAWAQSKNFETGIAQEWIALLKRKEEDPQNISFGELASFLRSRIGYDAWLLRDLAGYVHFLHQLPKDVFVLRYENFISGDNKDLAGYLGYELPVSRSVGKDLQRTLRTGQAGGWRSFFTSEDCLMLEQRYGKTLSEFGYDNWELTQDEPIRPEVCSEYAYRLILEARPGSL